MQQTEEIDLGIPTEAITLTELAQRVNKHVSTIWRWITRGVRGADGRMHVLSSEPIGGRQYVSAAEFRDWRDKVGSKPRQQSADRKSKNRDREMERKAKRALARK